VHEFGLLVYAVQIIYGGTCVHTPGQPPSLRLPQA
jgi:hypothetical protein